MRTWFKHSLLLAAMSLVATSACTPIADYQLGRKARQQGDYRLAASHLHPLAKRGYPDAQIDYGDLLREQNKPREAETWYSRAVEQGEVRAYGRLGKLYAEWVENGDPRYAARAEYFLRRALAVGETDMLAEMVDLYFLAPNATDMTIESLRQLINEYYRRDPYQGGYAAAKFIRLSGQLPVKARDLVNLCRPVVKQVPRCYLEIVSAYRADPSLGDINDWLRIVEQAYVDRQLEPRDLLRLIRWLGSPEQRMPEPALALLDLIDEESPEWAYRRAKLLYDYPQVGGAERLMTALARLEEYGWPEADLLLGRVYYDGELVPKDPQKAEQLFQSVREEFPAADYFLGQIYWHGYLGRSQPEQAVGYLLSAARRGYPNADRVLVDIFSSGKGVQPNPAYALSFVRLAIGNASDSEGTEKMQALYQDLLQITSNEQQQQAEAILAAELNVRQQQSAQYQISRRGDAEAGVSTTQR